LAGKAVAVQGPKAWCAASAAIEYDGAGSTRMPDSAAWSGVRISQVIARFTPLPLELGRLVDLVP
jgi:hypothetical protein